MPWWPSDKGHSTVLRLPLKKRVSFGHPAASLDRLWGLLLAKAGRDDQAFPLLKTAWDVAAGVRVDTEVAEALAKLAMARFDLQLATAVLDRWAREAPWDTKPLLWLAEIDRRLNSAPDHCRAVQAGPRSLLAVPAGPDWPGRSLKRGMGQIL